MIQPQLDSSAPFRKQVYALLIMVTAGLCAGRVLSTQLVFEPSLNKPHGPRTWPTTTPTPMPTYSSNDRARWATVRALVDGPGHEAQSPYVIGKRELLPDGKFKDSGIIFDDSSAWGTIDRVLHPERLEFYSSKPPLLPTLVAGEYWLLQRLVGWTLKDHPFEVVRTVLLTVNVFPLLIYLWLLSRIIERLGTSDWSRLFVMACACFGTYLTTFSTTLNNHTVAACAALFALYPCVGVWLDGKRDAWRFAVAGFFAAWTACNELPAAAFGVGLFIALVLTARRQTLLAFLPAAAIPIAAFLLTNYLAIGTVWPAYEKFGTEWYDYSGSHWARMRDARAEGRAAGIDSANDPLGVYVYHLLVGHHGIFSLTPIFLLSFVGMQLWPARIAGVLRWFGPALLALSTTIFAFYVWRTNNYGGWTSGPRWFFWLTPFWLIAMIPATNGLAASRWSRALAYVLLALSALSAAYPAWNPWRHPWLYNLLEYLGWIGY
jgi:hypothetical protein